jgi:hypothetical protein
LGVNVTDIGVSGNAVPELGENDPPEWIAFKLSIPVAVKLKVTGFAIRVTVKVTV